jgi:hypothetical protein
MRIDSLKKYEELVSTGIPDEEAKLLAYSLSIASETDFSIVATKDDIRGLEKEMKGFEKNIFYFGVLIFSCLAYLMFVK